MSNTQIQNDNNRVLQGDIDRLMEHHRYTGQLIRDQRDLNNNQNEAIKALNLINKSQFSINTEQQNWIKELQDRITQLEKCVSVSATLISKLASTVQKLSETTNPTGKSDVSTATTDGKPESLTYAYTLQDLRYASVIPSSISVPNQGYQPQ